MRRQVWALCTAIGAGILSVGAVTTTKPWWAAAWTVLAATAWKCGRAWQRQHPIPMPYSIRWLLLLPRGHSPQHLKRILEPHPGERILEIGPGTGTHALPVAAALLPHGVLDVLDVQQAMLHRVKQRAVKHGVTNIAATHGDAQELPYADHTFDAAYMITALGEIPDQAVALREVGRVLKPRGRLVIGEVIFDPDYISLSALEGTVRDAGFVLERASGSRLSYFALFHERATWHRRGPANRLAPAQGGANLPHKPALDRSQLILGNLDRDRDIAHSRKSPASRPRAARAYR